MEWININQQIPPETGRYLVSINLEFPGAGMFIFNYIAHYEREQGKWYKYDPFDPKYKPTVEVEGIVAAWAHDLGVFLAS